MCHGGVVCLVRYELHLFLSPFLKTNIWLWNLIHMLQVFFFSQTLIKALAFPPHCFSLQTLHRCCMPWKVVPCVCVRPWSNALILSGVYQLAASVDLNYTDTVHLSDLHSCCHLNICVLCDTEKCPRIQVSYNVVLHVKLSWKCMQISIYHLSLSLSIDRYIYVKVLDLSLNSPESKAVKSKVCVFVSCHV